MPDVNFEAPRQHTGANGHDPEPTVGQTLAAAIRAAFSSNYAIKHFCQCGEVSVLFGESGALKSFLAIDAGLTVAAQAIGGPRWLGRRVRGGGVLYIVGEGAAGVPRRLRAWVQHHFGGRVEDAAAALPFYVYPRSVDIHAGPGELAAVIAEAEAALGQPVRLVIVDPLGLMMGIGSEQLNADVARAFNNLRLALGPDRASLLVHHAGHGDKERERGAITIRTNADIRFRVEFDSFSRVMTLGHLKEKDGALADDSFLTFESVLLGHDDDADEVTSLILSTTSERPEKPDDKKGSLSPATVKALRALGSLWKGEPVVPADWRIAVHSAGLLNADEVESTESNKRTFQRHARALVNARLVKKDGTGSATTYSLTAGQ